MSGCVIRLAAATPTGRYQRRPAETPRWDVGRVRDPLGSRSRRVTARDGRGLRCSR